MSHHEHLIGADGVQHSDDVAKDVKVSVAGDVGGGVGVAVAPEVGSHGSVAERGEGVELVAPGVPKLGEAMEEENDWTFSFLREVNVDSVCPYSSVLYSISLHFQIPNHNLEFSIYKCMCQFRHTSIILVYHIAAIPFILGKIFLFIPLL